MIETATRTILVTNAAVLAVIVDRVWFGMRPQGERRPGIVITRIGGSDPGNLEGSAGCVRGTLQLDCLAPTYREAKELAAKAIDAIDGYSGKVGQTDIDYLSVDDDSDIPVIAPEGKSSPATFGVSLTVSFMIQS